jgi:hypothetical protein
MSESGFSEESLRKIAEQKINFKYSVMIHAAAFILVNALLLFINLLSTPGYYWVLYPLLGWNIGLDLHIIAYILYARGVYPTAKRGVIFHIFSYLAVMLLLFAIDMHIMDNLQFIFANIIWAYYPAVFWGFGLVVHIAFYRIYGRGDISEDGAVVSRKDKLIEKEMQKMKKRMD